MTYASIFGVTLGVAALVITLSVMGGFEADLKGRMFKGLPHMEVYHQNQFVGFSLDEHPVEEFQKAFPSAKFIEPFVKADIVLKNRKYLSSVVVWGVNKGSEGALWGFGDGMKLGDLSTLHSDRRLPGVVLGEDLAFELRVEVGDEVVGLSPGASISDALGGMELSKKFEVVGIFRTGLTKYDAKFAVVSLDQARFFMADYDESLRDENYVTGMAINFDNPENVATFVDKVNQFPDLEAQTWKEVNKSLLFALLLEKIAMSAVLFLIVLVAAFSIAATVMMTVYYKRHQISLFRALGMKVGDILKIFLSHGAVIGGAGVILGLSFGIAGCVLIERVGSIPLPEGVYMLQSLPVKYLYTEYAVIGLSAFFVTLLASIYPAYIASIREPAEGLRY